MSTETVDKTIWFGYNSAMKRKRWGEVKALAQKLGCHRVYLSAVLTGSVRPSVLLALKISNETGLDFFELRPDLKGILNKKGLATLTESRQNKKR